MATRIRLCEDDRDAYGGDEWLVFDQEALVDQDYDVLERYEDEMGMTLPRLLYTELPRFSVRARRGLAWLARQQAGLTEPGWADFKPRPLLIEMERVGGDDADPPANASGPSSETTASE